MLRKVFAFPIVLYRKIISPALPASCIYEPTCSSYAIEAIMKHGPIKGFFLGIARVFRCVGLLYTGGKDDVPDVFSFKAAADGYRLFFKKKHRAG